MTLLQTKQMIEAKPFIKWAGGKRDLVDFIISLMSKAFNHMQSRLRSFLKNLF